MMGCHHQTNKMKWHVYHHLPEFFRIKRFTDPQLERFRGLQLAGLKLIASMILGEPATLLDLVSHVNSVSPVSPVSPVSAGCEPTVAPEIAWEMRALIAQESWTDVEVIYICPLITPAALVHWRPLSYLFDYLSDAQQA